MASKFGGYRLAVFAGFFFSCCEELPKRLVSFLTGRGLTAELESFEPLDGFALAGNDLRLPDQRNGHEAHGNNAKHENEADVGLVSGKTQTAKPSHGRRSPSTRFDLLAVARANPSGQRWGRGICLTISGQLRGQDSQDGPNLISHAK